jgi:hypothetical protein
VKSILHLQRTIGNQAVQRMLLTDAGQPEAELTRPASLRFAHNFSRIPVHAPAAGVIQTKSAINKPGDEYEQEADSISEQVMRMPEPQVPRACARGGGCPECLTEQPGQEHKRLQTKRVQSGDTGQMAAPPIVGEVLRSPGQPLDPATRAFMEPRFGHDFSQVRVHTDLPAARSAEAVAAHAYTVGFDVVFGSGRYAPTGRDGQRLLAHELAHVAQQRDGSRVGATIPIGAPGSRHEHEADRAVHQLVRGTMALPQAAAPLQLSRQPRLTIVDYESGLTEKELAVIVVDAKKALGQTTQHSKDKTVKAGAQVSYQRGLKDIEKLVKRGDVIVYVIGAAKGEKSIPQARMEKVVHDIVAAQKLEQGPRLEELSKRLAGDLRETVDPKTGAVTGQNQYDPATSVSIVNVDLIPKRDAGGLRSIAGDVLHEGPGHRAMPRGYHNPEDKGVMSKNIRDSATEDQILFQSDEWDAVNEFLKGIVDVPQWNK